MTSRSASRRMDPAARMNGRIWITRICFPIRVPRSNGCARPPEGEAGSGMCTSPACSALETLATATEESDRGRLLSDMESLLARADAEAIELPLWELQNLWWKVTRNGAWTGGESEEAVARYLGFAGRSPS